VGVLVALLERPAASIASARRVTMLLLLAAEGTTGLKLTACSVTHDTAERRTELERRF
jgi:hypothetical protein